MFRSVWLATVTQWLNTHLIILRLRVRVLPSILARGSKWIYNFYYVFSSYQTPMQDNINLILSRMSNFQQCQKGMQLTIDYNFDRQVFLKPKVISVFQLFIFFQSVLHHSNQQSGNLARRSEFVNQNNSAASFCCQVAAWVPDMFCYFYLVKNHKVATNSATIIAREK